MLYKEFTYNDVFYNAVVTNPEYEFFIHKNKTYLKRESSQQGDFGTPTKNVVKHIPQGHISLYEINVNRPTGSLIYPFITKEGARTAFRTVSTSEFQDSSQFQFGDTIKGSYPLSASISRIFVPAGIEFDIQNFENQESPTLASSNKKYIRALKNPIDNDPSLSSYFQYGTKGTDRVNLVCVPSIFYGSRIQPGSVELNFYVTGSLAAQLKDPKKNGELVQTVGLNSGKIPGVVLYDKGIFVLTGSSTIHEKTLSRGLYYSAGSSSSPTWLTFGTGINEVGTGTGHGPNTNVSYSVKFKGVNKIPTITLLAHADAGEFNFSNNPTSTDYNNMQSASIGNTYYAETPGTIKNIKKSNYDKFEEPFENITFISKVGIYDSDHNLIGIASLANPVKKTELLNYTFK